MPNKFFFPEHKRFLDGELFVNTRDDSVYNSYGSLKEPIIGQNVGIVNYVHVQNVFRILNRGKIFNFVFSNSCSLMIRKRNENFQIMSIIQTAQRLENGECNKFVFVTEVKPYNLVPKLIELQKQFQR